MLEWFEWVAVLLIGSWFIAWANISKWVVRAIMLYGLIRYGEGYLKELKEYLGSAEGNE